MNEHRQRLASVEAMDPREGVWRTIAPLSAARSSCGLAALGGRLYAVGGSAADDAVHESVECFVPSMGSWIAAASLACGRTGLALTAL
jgi:hypothetical protein